jgi:hypothetical protein
MQEPATAESFDVRLSPVPRHIHLALFGLSGDSR